MLSRGVHLAHAQSCCYIFYIVIRDKIFKKNCFLPFFLYRQFREIASNLYFLFTRSNEEKCGMILMTYQTLLGCQNILKKNPKKLHPKYL